MFHLYENNSKMKLFLWLYNGFSILRKLFYGCLIDSYTILTLRRIRERMERISPVGFQLDFDVWVIFFCDTVASILYSVTWSSILPISFDFPLKRALILFLLLFACFPVQKYHRGVVFSHKSLLLCNTWCYCGKQGMVLEFWWKESNSCCHLIFLTLFPQARTTLNATKKG